MASIVSCTSKNITSKVILRRHKPICYRLLTTGVRSQKESSQVVDNKEQYENIPDFTKPLDSKNWVSYGFDDENPDIDKYKMHSVYFLGLLCLISFGFFTAYAPDAGHLHWAKREAYLILHEREKLGLDPVDKNYVDPEKMVLPTDEELEDFEIII